MFLIREKDKKQNTKLISQKAPGSYTLRERYLRARAMARGISPPKEPPPRNVVKTDATNCELIESADVIGGTAREWLSDVVR